MSGRCSAASCNGRISSSLAVRRVSRSLRGAASPRCRRAERRVAPVCRLVYQLAMLLSNGTIGEALVTELEATARDPLNSFAPTEEEEHKPKLATPSIVALIQGARPGIALTEPDQDAAIDAMRIA